MKTIQTLLLVSSLSAASLALAQTTPPADGVPPHRGGHGFHGRGPGGSPLVRALDTDHDGELSAAEIAAAATSLKALDADGDGNLSAAELHPARPARPANAGTPPAGAPANRPAPPAGAPRAGRPHPVDPVMLALDANGDGALSSAEIANAPKSLAALDQDKDGKLSREELHPLPPVE